MRTAFSAAMAATLHRAIAFANQRKHEYAALEHLLLGLLDDPDAAVVMSACKVDALAMKEALIRYLDTQLAPLVVADGAGA